MWIRFLKKSCADGMRFTESLLSDNLAGDLPNLLLTLAFSISALLVP
jgi:hypothetical protein